MLALVLCCPIVILSLVRLISILTNTQSCDLDGQDTGKVQELMRSVELSSDCFMCAPVEQWLHLMNKLTNCPCPCGVVVAATATSCYHLSFGAQEAVEKERLAVAHKLKRCTKSKFNDLLTDLVLGIG